MKTTMKTILTGSLLGLAAIAQAETAGPISLSANVSMGTDYVFRGFTQTSEDPTIQGGFDFNHEGGLYAGIWGSNVNFGSTDPAHLEVDYYIGFAGEASGVGYDFSYIYYAYPGVDDNMNYDFGEFKLGLSYNVISAEYYYSNDFFGGIGKAHYFKLGADFEVGNGIGLGAHVGRQNFDDDASTDYTDYGVSVSKSMIGVDFGLNYTNTNLDNVDDVADGRVFLTVGKSF